MDYYEFVKAVHTVPFSDLVGPGVLTACEFFHEDLGSLLENHGGNLDNCMSMIFCLNGMNYVALEDPSDGYRSSMAALFIDPSHVFNNVFPPVPVMAEMGVSDTVVFRDALTLMEVLEVGTDYTDDYYPSFVSNFNPKAAYYNQPQFGGGVTTAYNSMADLLDQCITQALKSASFKFGEGVLKAPVKKKLKFMKFSKGIKTVFKK